MGNGVGKFSVCFTGDDDSCRRHDVSVLVAEPLDEGLGHSFCYVRPDPTRISCSKVHSEEETTTFRAISGASVSANASTPLSTSILDFYAYGCIDKSSTFESSTSFSSIPLQPIPRCSVGSGPLSGNFDRVPGSGPLERGFLSGPIERGFLSGPLDRGIFSGPLENGGSDQFKRSFSHADSAFRHKSRKGRLIRGIRKAISKRISRGQNSLVAPIKAAKDPYWMSAAEKQHNQLRNENSTISSLYLSSEGSLEDYDTLEGQQSVQWAQGKAGEDRVHVVVSEEREWIFVGIYDGFNGPDAPDYLLSNLYRAIHKELRGLLWDDDKYDLSPVRASEDSRPDMKESLSRDEYDLPRNRDGDACSSCFEQENYPCANIDLSSDWSSKRKKNSSSRSKHRGPGKKWEENQRKWKCEWDRERLELDRRLKEQLSRSGSHDDRSINHCDVLKALSQALNKTEETFLDIADKMVVENPELALMGSCVLVMLMKGEDVYVMNVGDSRAVLAQKAGPDYRIGKVQQDLEKIKEETLYDIEASDWDQPSGVVGLNAFQLSVDHSTSVEEEVQRIKKEHPDDASALVNDRVKGSLIVTRAFGAGYLKQPKWNDALLKRFRIDYVGSSPYITCSPSLYHHKLGPKDRFLILSSDGLYQYFTNEEAVAAVELFIDLQPEGDPAQHLIEEVLFRAAKKAGIEFHDLLEIPHGDPRRRYHDDISIIIISLEGRIWRSSV